jgi:hypothetical protein
MKWKKMNTLQAKVMKNPWLKKGLKKFKNMRKKTSVTLYLTTYASSYDHFEKCQNTKGTYHVWK